MHVPGEFVMYDSTLPVDADLEAAVEAWLTNNNPCEDCGAFAIMNVYVYGTQSSVSIIGLNYGVAEPDWSLSDMAWADSITFDANYNQTESVLVAADPIESGVDNAVWPWAQGQTAQFGTAGVHGAHPSTSPATDWFLKSASFSGDGPNSVVASQSARVDWSCREPSTNQIGVHAGAFTYIHLVNQPGLSPPSRGRGLKQLPRPPSSR